MTTEQKIKLIEAAFGGSVRAAKAAGVSYTTWYRWASGRQPVSGMSEVVIDLLLKSDEVKALGELSLLADFSQGAPEPGGR